MFLVGTDEQDALTRPVFSDKLSAHDYADAELDCSGRIYELVLA